MKVTKKLIIVFLLGTLIFGGYVQYKKMTFDKIYENREDYAFIYSSLYKTGKLDIIKSYLIDYYDSIADFKKIGSQNVYLSSIANQTNDTNIISTSNYLMEIGFNNAQISYNDSLKYEVQIRRTFLRYKLIPTYHYLIYSKRHAYKYRFTANSYWFFYSSEGERYDYDNFLDFRPEWSLPYFEAFEFFRKNPTFIHEH